jgi:hypothetical protein
MSAQLEVLSAPELPPGALRLGGYSPLRGLLGCFLGVDAFGLVREVLLPGLLVDLFLLGTPALGSQIAFLSGPPGPCIVMAVSFPSPRCSLRPPRSADPPRRPTGTVALAGARARRTYPSRRVLDHEGQFGERVGETSRRSDIGPEVVESPAEVLDEGVPGHDHPRSSVTLQPSHRSKAGLETPVVGLERIVGVALRVVEGGREQLIEDARVDPVPVGGDLGG